MPKETQSNPDIITGGAVNISVELKNRDGAVSVAGATITAQCVRLEDDINGIPSLISKGPSVSQSAATSGADWANGIVVITMSATESNQITIDANYGTVDILLDIVNGGQTDKWLLKGIPVIDGTVT